MSKQQSFIFVSIDGMTDPLGQSQVLPYLVGLSQIGYKISIVSCEKKDNWDTTHLIIEEIVKKAGIDWNYCFYKQNYPIISQIKNFTSLKKIAFKLVLNNKTNDTILHCRSYLPGLIGLSSKKRFNTGFIFDMRGFWADERIDGGIWKKSNLAGSVLYNYFKQAEKKMLIQSDAIISLTNQAKKIILNWNLGIDGNKITVIPCCSDLNHFSKNNIDPNKLDTIKTKLPQLKDKFVLSYIGSLGTWYMADEMLAFFKVLLEKKKSHFLIITKDSENIIFEAAEKHQVPVENFTILSATRSDMPYYITLSDASLFFIRPTFSKSASSPTKMGELLSMEVPIITNTGIGDVDEIIRNSNCGVLIEEFKIKNYELAVDNTITNSDFYKKNTINTAQEYFSLQKGIEKYTEVYKHFLIN